MLRKIVALLTAFMAVTVALVINPAEAADLPSDYAIDNGHFYTQGAGGGAKGGFSVTDDGGIPMWSEYGRLGGVDVLGFPVSGRFMLAGHVVQLTQKAGLLWRPDLQQVQFLNIFSLLHNTGKDPWLAAIKAVPPQVTSPDEANKTWEQIAQKRYQLLDVHPAIKSAYFAMSDPVSMYGLPTSSWLEQPVSSVMRFDNVVFQQWKQLLPWAAAGQVQMANGGDILKESGILGPVPFALQAPPQPAIQAVPAGFAVISFYADFFVGRHTSNGAVFTQDGMTCATNAFPLGTRLRLTTPDGGHSVVVTNNDRPAVWNTRIDLSKAAFQTLYPLGRGIGNVKVEVVK
ncbi:MAG TPA: septal ring lytic transglycosylase RlpA family protein [Chloroflexota bacterium]|nr:septal ring lytic transglycosylase RlpA family protein [Chloroflexota bacterium]